MTEMSRINVLTIAGADSGGGSGIQADLKTFAAFGMHGLSAITAVTAQNMTNVIAVQAVPARWLERQLRAVFAGFRVSAVKIGMLGSAANVIAVAAALRAARVRNVVLDPVLASSSGTALLSARGIRILREQLMPLVDLATPNLPEATILLGSRVREIQMSQAAQALRALGARAVLLKGGHGRARVVRDILVDANDEHEYRHPRLALRARGTGCVLSAGIAAGLAAGRSLPNAVAAAEDFLQTALRAGYRPTRDARRVLDVFAKR
jgi:hydroxymethylpyrimidine/phosphomethylpyrimidine kinase